MTRRLYDWLGREKGDADHWITAALDVREGVYHWPHTTRLPLPRSARRWVYVVATPEIRDALEPLAQRIYGDSVVVWAQLEDDLGVRELYAMLPSGRIRAAERQPELELELELQELELAALRLAAREVAR